MLKMARKILSIITVLFVIPTLLLGFTSCIYDEEEIPAQGNDEGTGPAMVVLRVNPLSESPSDSYTNNEKIASIRVIMLSGDTLQVNNKYFFTAQSIKDFAGTYTYYTTPATKDFYIIANEESIGDFHYKDASGKLNNGSDITTFLNSFKTDGKSNPVNGRNIRTVLESLYFTPGYPEAPETEVYLPYSSYYSGVKVNGESDYYVNPFQMYIVPVATKFFFRFINHRPHDVELSNIKVSNFNNENFLMGHVAPEEQKKDFEGENLYWVNWLARVSEESHKFVDTDQNVNFNSRFGWIYNYDMPFKSNTYPRQFYGQKNEIKPVKAYTDIDGPGVEVLGPYYAPESWNEYEYSLDGIPYTDQRYTLTLGLHDVSQNATDDPDFTDETIGNVKALFRNTCVLINIRMYAGELEVYAEKVDWNYRAAKGYVVTTKPN